MPHYSLSLFSAPVEQEVYIMANQKHLTLENRIAISQGLNDHFSFKKIANSLGKDCTTISKEVRIHRIFEKTGYIGRPFNDCIHRMGCTQAGLCQVCNSKRNIRCCFCSHCIHNCPSYERETCPKLQKAPYVCNGCNNNKCSLEKARYNPVYAEKEYRLTLSESRSGWNLSEKELASLDRIISPLLKNGHSIHHICANHKDEIMICEKTLYTYVNAGLFQARNVDLPRKVRLRPRRGAKKPVKVDKKCRIGRTINEFNVFREQHPEMPVAELDSVEGVKGGPVLLTIHFVQAKLQLAFKRESNDSTSVTDIFNRLYGLLGSDSYKKVLSLLLADNGSEFSNPEGIEKDSDGNIRSRLFYCDASAPGQKGHCENNHEFIRRIIPKGVEIGKYSEEQISLMMNHVNSYGRKELNDKSPYEMFAFLYGDDILKKLGVKPVPRDEIILKPHLLKTDKEEDNGRKD